MLYVVSYQQRTAGRRVSIFKWYNIIACYPLRLPSEICGDFRVVTYFLALKDKNRIWKGRIAKKPYVCSEYESIFENYDQEV
jgi:hypothetical protein